MPGILRQSEARRASKGPTMRTYIVQIVIDEIQEVAKEAYVSGGHMFSLVAVII